MKSYHLQIHDANQILQYLVPMEISYHAIYNLYRYLMMCLINLQKISYLLREKL